MQKDAANPLPNEIKEQSILLEVQIEKRKPSLSSPQERRTVLHSKRHHINQIWRYLLESFRAFQLQPSHLPTISFAERPSSRKIRLSSFPLLSTSPFVSSTCRGVYSPYAINPWARYMSVDMYLCPYHKQTAESLDGLRSKFRGQDPIVLHRHSKRIHL